MKRAVIVVCALSLINSAVIAIGVYRIRSPELTTHDLALAMGAQWWTLRVPEGVEGQCFGITYKTEDGYESHGGVECVLEPGTVLRLFIYDLQEPRLRFAAIGPGMSFQGSVPNRFASLPGPTGGVPSPSEVRSGQVLMKASASGTVRVGDEMLPGEIGLAFHFERD
jgi:hypothetical protein